MTFYGARYPGGSPAAARFTFEKLSGAAKAGAPAGDGWGGAWFESDGGWFGEAADRALPEAVVVPGAYPNPFRGHTRIGFALPSPMPVRLCVYDVLGREVARLVDGVLEAGGHEVPWEAGPLPRGVYVYRLDVAGRTERGTLLLMK